jgi:hypothetical protein
MTLREFRELTKSMPDYAEIVFKEPYDDGEEINIKSMSTRRGLKSKKIITIMLRNETLNHDN